MLRKLLKYELKSTARTFGLVYLVMVILCSLSGALDALSSLITINDAVAFSFMAITILFFFAAIVMTTVLNLNRFSKGVFQSEGYLLNTLPVAPWQIICSKLVPALLWTMVTVLVMGVSLLLMLLTSSAVSFQELLDLFQAIAHFFTSADPQEILELLADFGWLFLLGFAALAAFILQVYAAISLGHLFPRHRTAWSVGIWFALNWLQSTAFDLLLPEGGFAGVASSYTYAFRSVMVSADLAATSLPQLAFYLVWAALFWGAAQFVLTKKLNLE